MKCKSVIISDFKKQEIRWINFFEKKEENL